MFGSRAPGEKRAERRKRSARRFLTAYRSRRREVGAGAVRRQLVVAVDAGGGREVGVRRTEVRRALGIEDARLPEGEEVDADAADVVGVRAEAAVVPDPAVGAGVRAGAARRRVFAAVARTVEGGAGADAIDDVLAGLVRLALDVRPALGADRLEPDHRVFAGVDDGSVLGGGAALLCLGQCGA